MSDGTGEGGDARSDNLLNLTGAPGVEFLSPPERLLCSELHLLPGYYLVIKVGARVLCSLFVSVAVPPAFFSPLDARVYGGMTAAMHDMSTPPPPPPLRMSSLSIPALML